ncbi:GNAT family N-acetyltransferase [Shewanella gaetbuli]|uniref:N-acetyltransferase n=1 Tax=Shewanella gaetbuli TaxID=220752 RepID=A0A9X2CJF4_9GAMM|nr:N-acetyltransferase [Shewanella gaetbuli]MCL1141976.1 N-acetyltransferase [Shewanella gaetbuli]
MIYSSFTAENSQEVIGLFKQVFSAAEGDDEGRVIAQLVTDIITTTAAEDLLGFIATQDKSIVGAIFFSRFILPNNALAFLLSPVAVATETQGQGVGQQLINFGLEQLKLLAVNTVVTYGDPAFYTKVGFEQIDESIIKAPFPLSQPIGWLGQSLNHQPLQAVVGDTQCVAALSRAEYW